MLSSLTVYSFAALVPAAVSAALAGFAYRHRHRRGVPWAGILFASVALWAFGYSMELLRSGVEWKLFCSQFQYLGIAMVPGAWFWLAASHAGWAQARSPRWIGVSSLAPWRTNGRSVWWRRSSRLATASDSAWSARVSRPRGSVSFSYAPVATACRATCSAGRYRPGTLCPTTSATFPVPPRRAGADTPEAPRAAFPSSDGHPGGTGSERRSPRGRPQGIGIKALAARRRRASNPCLRVRRGAHEWPGDERRSCRRCPRTSRS
jgi:hypothetical protein